MPPQIEAPAIRVLPEDVANKIAAGEVVERPASVVKELVENALDAGSTRISVRVIAAGRRLIEVIDNGHGMSEQNTLLAIERHATSKVRNAKDLESIKTLGFRGEALASIASVSRFELVSRRVKDDAATRVRIEGGILRDASSTGAPVGTRVTVNRLYFNTPVRAKFLKGITTELGHCIDIVQRHALAAEGVAFQFTHNDKLLLDIPQQATLRERIALIWGLAFVRDMTEVSGEQAGYKVRGVIGLPGLTRAQRSHQFFFMNRRPVVNRSLQYGFEDGYRGLVTIGRHPVGVILLEAHPRFVDVNIHPTKREVRFRDERAVRDAVRDIVRAELSEIAPEDPVEDTPSSLEHQVDFEQEASADPVAAAAATPAQITPSPVPTPSVTAPAPPPAMVTCVGPATSTGDGLLPGFETPTQGEFGALSGAHQVAPNAVYQSVTHFEDAPMQLFDTYLLVPGDERLLIIDQHALHERLNFDSLCAELDDHAYESQQLAVPIVIEVAPAQVRLVESNLKLFAKLGIEIEPFGTNTFQITAICHLYEDAKVRDLIYRVLDELAQGDLFDRDNFMRDVFRLASRACKASIRAGDRLTPQERRGLIEGFRRLRPPYTCPHGRPIITELTLRQMEKSFRRVQ